MVKNALQAQLLKAGLVDNKKANSRKDDKYLDSVVVEGTSGNYDPFLKKWDGKGGTVNWLKEGLGKDEVFATLSHYNVSCRTPNLTVDTVFLTTKYFSKPILGSLSDRAFTINREEDKIYPQFLSFEKRLKIKNCLIILSISKQINDFYLF